MLSNLPPGVTDAMIEEQCGTDEDVNQWRCDCAVKAANMWNGEDLPELIFDLLARMEFDEMESQDVIAEIRGELKMRELKRGKAEK